MTAPARSPYSLAWRLALTVVIVRVAYAVLLQGYTLVGLPESAQLRETFSLPQYLVPFLTNIAASSIFVGLTVWSTMHRWLRQKNTHAVHAPGRLFGVVIILTLVFSLAVSALMIYLQSALVLYAAQHASAANKFLTLGLFLGALAVALEVLGAYLAVRIATRTVQPADQAGGPAYEQRHAAWSAGLMILGWQLSVCIAMGSYLNAQSLTVGWLQYALGFLILPALLLVLCTVVCLRILPHPIGAARQGRAVALGTLAFWLAQVLGVGLGFLAIRAMTWDQLIRAADSNVVAVVMLVVYAALLVLGCWVGKLALYGGSRKLVPAG
ncbi:hypothetical protein [Achromobacter spanius]|uniref:Uncharacterized protein n=1 Tax=Achromobacter spanius TaxID=217203 RepID=A0A2S0I617_9BURK|nr:hypothetical protein [Achromobacter spanius]AVJ27458.1 hypothetical protein CLM73_10235 [Achromobacter spanius]